HAPAYPHVPYTTLFRSAAVLPFALFDVQLASRIRVVLRQRAITNNKELYIFEQARPGPKTIALVAINLVESFTNIDPTALEFDVHHRQAVHQNCHVVAGGMLRSALTFTGFILINNLKPVVVDICLIQQSHIFSRAIIAPQQLNMVLMDTNSLLNDAIVATSDTLRKELIPLSI